MRELIESIALEGTTLRVTVREPLPLDRRTLALAAAIRVFERFPVLTRVATAVEGSDAPVAVLSREEIERLVGPEGFTALRAWGGWRQVLARAVQAHLGEAGE